MRVSIYLLTSDLLSFIISNTDKHDFSSVWKWSSCCNDVMNHADYLIKRDVYPQKMNSCQSKDICGIAYFDLKISVVCQQKYTCISWVILHGYSRSRKIKSVIVPSVVA